MTHIIENKSGDDPVCLEDVCSKVGPELHAHVCTLTLL